RLSVATLPCLSVFFVADAATAVISPLSLHDALPICAVFLPFSSSSRSAWWTRRAPVAPKGCPRAMLPPRGLIFSSGISPTGVARSEEHTSELQSLAYLVCRLLLEKKNKTNTEKTLWG